MVAKNQGQKSQVRFKLKQIRSLKCLHTLIQIKISRRKTSRGQENSNPKLTSLIGCKKHPSLKQVMQRTQTFTSWISRRMRHHQSLLKSLERRKVANWPSKLQALPIIRAATLQILLLTMKSRAQLKAVSSITTTRDRTTSSRSMSLTLALSYTGQYLHLVMVFLDSIRTRWKRVACHLWRWICSDHLLFKG